MNLFREEVFQAKKNRLFGDVVINQPAFLYVITTAVFVLFIVLSIYISQSSYSRKETVKGYLIPEKGLMKVFLNRSGVVGDLLVEEGSKVNAGDGLAKIINSQSLSSGVELSDILVDELEKQKVTLSEELRVIYQIQENDINQISLKLAQLEDSLNVIKKIKLTVQKKLELKERLFTNNKELYERGYISKINLFDSHEEYLNIRESMDGLDREILDLVAKIADFEVKKNSIPNEVELKRISIERRISEINMQILELKNKYEFIVKAPESGTVTAIQAYTGTNINNNVPLLSIIPEDSILEIEMLLPTRSAGFIQIGDPVRIRFDAFPYQKFGSIKGEVTKIDKALLLPTDQMLPIRLEEASYKVSAKLEKQEIVAYDKSFSLKVGMIAEADIILENRSLLDWLLDPIYALQGKL
ncbi:HlyD family efflux transporter periplasmic adaptor subunit [Vibrio cholerae]|uniref:HlyD family efflux transporter periplasmic adaptor subunit n=1 Tax=Vibrio cholerae TaxID=666 RepID=UPI001157970F|nr:HlyD family efflux transporter periplasmic adaptor subunit [Vibrio cholerae]EKF9231134.1 HlyD family efflux transporter periplasmic adaptor subunit [Vibrio cholerae]MDY7587608.1 HlyD family efflux transporter periplasmic adaptor subunit [Vibrio cholerae]TQP03874.1 HlyD family efflux transporter periplasmic adaptor subunit [Vibrio cholerae]